MGNRPRFEVADIFRAYGPSYRQAHSATISERQLRVMAAIESCRTAALGGHVDQCDSCGHRRISYNSCRDRHCPKCQSLAQAKWLEQQESKLLPVQYFHVVFTIPDSMAFIALGNKRVVYKILFRAVSETLLTIAADPKHLGAKIGVLAILHTWGSNLQYHPHIHCVIPGGGLSSRQKKWIACRMDFFLSVKVLSRVFRGKMLDFLWRAFRSGDLKFTGKHSELNDADHFDQFLEESRKSDWVVYCKPPFGSPSLVLRYLGRYTHRIAISNHRILNVQNGKVTFRWKDYKRKNLDATMTLDAPEFIRRFLLHVLPKGFVRIRSYGLLSNSSPDLITCRKLLISNIDVSNEGKVHEDQDWKKRYENLTGQSLDCCPRCHQGQMICVEVLQPTRNREDSS